MKIGFLSNTRIIGMHPNSDEIPNLEEYQYVELPADFEFKPGFESHFIDGVVVQTEIIIETPEPTDAQVTMTLVLDLYMALEAKGVI